MDLTQISHNIELAKQDNTRWLEYADALIHGNTVNKDGIPKYREECIPCQWLYDHSDEVSRFYRKIDKVEVEFFHFDIMEQIEVLRYDLHEKYLFIFKTYLPDMNHSIFAFLFRSNKRRTEYDHIAAQRQFREMKRIVEELNKKLEQLELSLNKMCQLNIA